MGRVCYHPCETACNRAQVDEAVGINSVERFLGDEAIKRGWTIHAAGDATAASACWWSAPVRPACPRPTICAAWATPSTIHEAGPAAGGMMRFGIPKYRLPRDVLDAEVKRILDIGVELKLNTKVDNILDTMKAGRFDAAFLAVGAHIGKRAFIPAGSAAKVLDAVTMLRSMEGEDKPLLGRRVVVYGGGNTAIDAARTAKRLGATEAIIVYRRTRERMPAHDFEVEEALEEGIMMKWLSTIKRMDEGKLTVEKMQLDDKGFPQPTGEFETLEADSLVLALGQDVDLSLLDGVPGLEIKDGMVQVAPNMMTGHAGIFAGGDMVPSERTVTVAVGHGKKAARHIDAWLRGATYAPAGKARARRASTSSTPGTTPTRRRRCGRCSKPRAAQSTFEEVQGGLDETNALYEARRCLSCGNCFECDNCYGVCPDNAVIKLGPGNRFKFNYDYCKGCGSAPPNAPAAPSRWCRKRSDGPYRAKENGPASSAGPFRYFAVSWRRAIAASGRCAARPAPRKAPNCSCR